MTLNFTNKSKSIGADDPVIIVPYSTGSDLAYWDGVRNGTLRLFCVGDGCMDYMQAIEVNARNAAKSAMLRTTQEHTATVNAVTPGHTCVISVMGIAFSHVVVLGDTANTIKDSLIAAINSEPFFYTFLPNKKISILAEDGGVGIVEIKSYTCGFEFNVSVSGDLDLALVSDGWDVAVVRTEDITDAPISTAAGYIDAVFMDVIMTRRMVVSGTLDTIRSISGTMDFGTITESFSNV